MKDIRMMRNLLLLEVNIQETTTTGIHLTESARPPATSGTVVAVGPDATIEEGEFVLYKEYIGNEIEHADLKRSGYKYIVVSEDDILCVAKKESEFVN